MGIRDPATVLAWAARQILQADLALLGGREGQVTSAEEQIAALLPATTTTC